MKHIKILLVMAFIISAGVWADQPMDTGEILQLFDRLCQQPADAWIPQGQIEATHEFVDFLSGEEILSRETVTTDGDRFIGQQDSRL